MASQEGARSAEGSGAAGNTGSARKAGSAGSGTSPQMGSVEYTASKGGAMLGYAAMFEQFTPSDLLTYCRQAERAGFRAVMASDHFHPWTPGQGQSGFVWTWLGALGATTGLRFGTGVTPPGPRYHPAIVAQAAATVAQMFPGRFWLGLGAGEALNEHITGEYWPDPAARLEKLAESIEIIRQLFTGKRVNHRGKYFTVERARLYTRPENDADLPPLYVATSGPIQSERTGRTCDGIITVGAADQKIADLMKRFERGARASGRDPSTLRRVIQLHVSWAESDDAAMENAVREWPNGGMNFPKADIREPEDFEAMARLVRPEHYKGRVLVSADPEVHREHIQHYLDLGFQEVYIHNVGRNQEAFIKLYSERVIPELRFEVSAGGTK